jgi:hypothetical protein
MTSAVIRFPPRRSAAVWLLQPREGGWLVLARGHGWLHGSRSDALANASWLARNLDLSIREAT